MSNDRTRAWPALVALAAILGIVVFMLVRGDDDDKPAPPASAPAPATMSRTPSVPVSRPAQAKPAMPVAAEEVVPEETQTVSEEEKRRTGLDFPPDTDPEFVAQVKEQRKDWKPLTYDEMVDKSKPFVETMALREELLIKEIAEAERAGDEDRAARRRVELERLRQRKRDLEAALAKGKIP